MNPSWVSLNSSLRNGVHFVCLLPRIRSWNLRSATQVKWEKIWSPLSRWIHNGISTSKWKSIKSCGPFAKYAISREADELDRNIKKAVRACSFRLQRLETDVKAPLLHNVEKKRSNLQKQRGTQEGIKEVRNTYQVSKLPKTRSTESVPTGENHFDHAVYVFTLHKETVPNLGTCFIFFLTKARSSSGAGIETGRSFECTTFSEVGLRRHSQEEMERNPRQFVRWKRDAYNTENLRIATAKLTHESTENKHHWVHGKREIEDHRKRLSATDKKITKKALEVDRPQQVLVDRRKGPWKRVLKAADMRAESKQGKYAAERNSVNRRHKQAADDAVKSPWRKQTIEVSSLACGFSPSLCQQRIQGERLQHSLVGVFTKSCQFICSSRNSFTVEWRLFGGRNRLLSLLR